MDAAKFKQYLTNRYEKQLAWYDEKSVLNKRLAYFFQIPVILFASLLPIFTVVDFKLITIILSSLIAIFIGIFNFCKFEEKWHNYRTTCEMLKKEFYLYDSKIEAYEDVDDPEQTFVKRVEALISTEHTKWLTIEKNKKKETTC